MHNTTLDRTPEELAAAVAATMMERDNTARHLGVAIDEIRPGYARARMKIRDFMLNSHGTCHGGMLFAFADTAFAYACNSGNENTVAAGCTIDFLAPGHAGDTLTAVAVERSRAGRTGVYDVDISDQKGTTIAVFRGRSHRVKGTVVGLPPAEES